MSHGFGRRAAWRLGVLLLGLSTAACGSAPELEPDPAAREELQLDLQLGGVAPIASGLTVAPLDAAARDAVAAGRYDEARGLYERLSHLAPEPRQRAEYLFRAAESALGARDRFLAYELYRRLLLTYPNTPHFPTVVERIFLIGRLYAEGVAEKPSWLLGIDMTDREFGVQVLERFQQGRERHELADDALHFMAVGRVALNEPELAITAWEQLISGYPRSEWAQTAEYRVGLTMLSMSDGPEYDKVPLLAGLARLRRYLERYPTGDHVQEAEQAVARTEQAIAAHELEVVQHYLQRDREYSAAVYLLAIQREYPGTAAAKEAQTILASLPKTSAPPPPPEPEEEQSEDDEDRLRIAPAPLDDTW